MNDNDNGIYTKQVLDDDGTITVYAINTNFGPTEMKMQRVDEHSVADQIEAMWMKQSWWDGLANDGQALPITRADGAATGSMILRCEAVKVAMETMAISEEDQKKVSVDCGHELAFPSGVFAGVRVRLCAECCKSITVHEFHKGYEPTGGA